MSPYAYLPILHLKAPPSSAQLLAAQHESEPEGVDLDEGRRSTRKHSAKSPLAR